MIYQAKSTGDFRIVNLFSTFFAHELKYSSSVYSETTIRCDCYLFRLDGADVGAVVFHQAPGGFYFLDWIWIMVEARNKGLLKAAWIEFVARYGDFAISRPLSDNLKAFVLKYGTPMQALQARQKQE